MHRASQVVCAETETMDESLPEEVLLDENAESEKHTFFMTGGAPGRTGSLLSST